MKPKCLCPGYGVRKPFQERSIAGWSGGMRGRIRAVVPETTVDLESHSHANLSEFCKSSHPFKAGKVHARLVGGWEGGGVICRTLGGPRQPSILVTTLSHPDLKSCAGGRCRSWSGSVFCVRVLFRDASSCLDAYLAEWAWCRGHWVETLKPA